MSFNIDSPRIAPYSLEALSWPEVTAPVRRPESGWYPVFKAVLDYLAALGLFVATFPFLAAALLAVRLTSRGPAIYRQTRLGIEGRPFTIFKVRSMYHECERLTGACWASKNDPRVTPVGRFLRFTHLDELPQLWNVLRGEMSLIGPRPERPEIVPGLERTVPRYRERLAVRPGVTGLAQIQSPADSDTESVRRKLAYDLYYIETGGAWMDLRILLGTVLKAAGVSFPRIRRLFKLPTPDEVESAYRGTDIRTVATPLIQPA
jgi:lipopolysaccharide/colanic/teichoic acid biosynthesis glycosyltransferase